MLRNIVLASVLFLSYGIAAGQQNYPERIILEHEGQEAAYYKLGFTQYRLFSLYDTGKIAAGVPVCFSVKVEDSQNKEDILFYGSTNLGIRFKLAEGIKLPADKIGANLVVGCLKSAEDENTFLIKSAALMPGDLELFKKKKDYLLKDKNKNPENFFMLGDWIDMAKKQSQIIEEDVYEKYVSEGNDAYLTALELCENSLTDNPDSLKSNLLRMQSFVRKMGEAPEGKAAAIASLLYKKFISKHKNIITLLDSDKIKKTDIAKYSADYLLMVARIYDELLLKRSSLEKLYAKAAEYYPRHPVIEKRMKAKGFVFFNNKWITSQKKKRILEEQEKLLSAVAEKSKPEVVMVKKENSVKKDLVGKGVEKAKLDTEYLLGLENNSGLKELSKALNDMPLEVAKYAVFQMVSWYQQESQEYLSRVLLSEKTELKVYAAALLCALGEEDSKHVSARFADEKDENVLKRYTDFLWRLRGSAGIGSMISIVRNSKVSDNVKRYALEKLKKKTGADFGLDSFAWKKWWAENRNHYNK